ncbi:MAG TPA: hypothetical protein VGR98_10795 [Streptosporangiaceae bacterium]|jgi:hypothetical protein|nr:hypothetical protein [Streptosporangiaceae bacterium]
MFTKNLLAAGLAVAVGCVLAGCGGAASPADPPPASLRAIPGSPVKEVLLTARAEQRLGIVTQPVRAAAGPSGGREVIPYAAVVYDNDGSTWTYVNITGRTFVRQPIVINAIQGSEAVLDRGPAVGAPVVTVGAPELLGTEYDISGEQ